jgi:5-methylcytosine-specific restriction endonuclease McrA
MPWKDPEKNRESTRNWIRRNKAYVRAYNKKWQKDHAEYMRKRNAEYRRLNPDKILEKDRRYRKRCPEAFKAKDARRRARLTEAGGSFTVSEWKSLCRKFHNRCLCCGKRRKLTPDHVIPVSKLGSSNIDNIQPLCGPCNSRKKDRTIDFRITLNLNTTEFPNRPSKSINSYRKLGVAGN